MLLTSQKDSVDWLLDYSNCETRTILKKFLNFTRRFLEIKIYGQCSEEGKFYIISNQFSRVCEFWTSPNCCKAVQLQKHTFPNYVGTTQWLIDWSIDRILKKYCHYQRTLTEQSSQLGQSHQRTTPSYSANHSTTKNHRQPTATVGTIQAKHQKVRGSPLPHWQTLDTSPDISQEDILHAA